MAQLPRIVGHRMGEWLDHGLKHASVSITRIYLETPTGKYAIVRLLRLNIVAAVSQMS